MQRCRIIRSVTTGIRSVTSGTRYTSVQVASTILRDIDTGMYCLLVETVVRGYHVYKVLWELHVGETFIALHEINSN